METKQKSWEEFEVIKKKIDYLVKDPTSDIHWIEFYIVVKKEEKNK